jgi:hypothetical protein
MQTRALPVRRYAKDICRQGALVLASWLTLSSPSPAQAQSFTIDTSAASPLTGLWWNAGESGWGATITQQSDIMFVTMFVYDAAGNPVWYTVSCTISSATCSGDMLRVRGGSTPTASWSGSGIAVAVAGDMALNFTSNDAGSMSYTLNGVAATRQIARQIFGPPPPAAPCLAGTWYGAIIEIRNNCTHPQNNGGRATYGQYDIIMGAGTSGAVNISLAGVTSLQCGYTGSYTTNGARLLANGSVQCSDGKRGSWQSTNMLVTAKAMSLELAVQLDTTETCTIAATLGGSRP